MGKKLTKEDIERKLPEYKIIGELKNIDTKVRVKHLKCGYEWDAKLATMLRSKNPTGCPQCSNNLLTKEKLLEQLAPLGYSANFENIETLKSNTVLEFTCSEGHTWKTKIGNILYNNTRCPECSAISKRMSPEVAYEKFSKELGEDYQILSQYINAKTKLKVLHKTCNQTFETTTASILRGRRCPYCNGDKLKTTDEFKAEVKSLCGDSYTVLGKYTGKDKLILMKHNENCGKEFYVTPNHFLSLGTRCPFHSSKSQKEVYDFLKENYTGEIVYNEKSVITPRELDIFIPELKIGIEFDGLYWHSEGVVGKNYQVDKLKACEEKGIRLITIFEDEWLEKPDIVKDKLLHIIGLHNSYEKVYARKSVIKEISSKEKNEFLNKNHIQGQDNANIKLGLFYNEELVSVMTFARSRMGIGHNTGKTDCYELSRFANDITKNVIGSFGKLLKYFEYNYKPKLLISYADLRWSSKASNIYIKNNFNLKIVNKPNYWYFLNKQRFHRFSFRKTMIQKRFPEIYNKNETEFEMMNKTKYRRIWDCGTIAYEKIY